MILQKLNFQYLFSYSGLIPYIFIIFDKYFFLKISEELTSNFVIYYTILILVFIGSLNWSFETIVKNSRVIYGFLPSLFGFVIIILNLINFNKFYIILLIMFALIAQLIFDYIFIFLNKINKNYFYFLRFPLTITILSFLSFIII